MGTRNVRIKQSKLESFVEACLNTASGFIIAMILTTFFSYVDNPILFLGDGLSPHEIVLWTLIMTVVSVLRSYFWRRVFANEVHKLVHIIIDGVLKKGKTNGKSKRKSNKPKG